MIPNSKLVDAVCVQDFPGEEGMAKWMRMEKSSEGELTVTARDYGAIRDIVANSIEELDDAIVRQLLKVGEKVEVEYNLKIRLDVQVFEKLGAICLDIARTSRRGIGNVIIGSKGFVEAFTPMFEERRKNCKIFEHENVPNQTFVVLYRGTYPLTVMCDGSPILLLNNKDDFTQPFKYGWTGLDVADTFVKVVHFNAI
jgi:hypothetical protein